MIAGSQSARSQPSPVFKTSAEDKSTDRVLRATHTLASLIDLALSQSQFVSAARIRIEEMRFSARQARALPNPQVGFSLGRKSVSSEYGPIYEAALTQPFSFPGKLRLRSEISNQDVEITKLRADGAELALISTVIRLAYEYANNRRRMEFSRRRHHHLSLVKTYMDGHSFASPQKKVERSLVENRLRDLVSKNIKTESDLKTSLERLHLYMNESISSAQVCKKLVRRVLEQFRVPYITITPTFSICPKHGYLSGQHAFCPKCDEELIVVKQRELSQAA